MNHELCVVDQCTKARKRRSMCDTHYQQWWRKTPKESRESWVRPNRSVEDRFWDKVSKAGDCWTWTGATSDTGYGTIVDQYPSRKSLLAHRVSYEIANGPIPEGMVIRHKCDNPQCVNPAHLLIGTHADNSDDKVTRKRHAWGERSPKAKLTEDQVLSIRQDGRNRNEIAAEYGIHPNHVNALKRGTFWKELPNEAA